MKSLIWIISWLISGILLCPGFITSFDRFVDRKEGWEIAKSNNQIQFGNDDEDDVLISVY